MILFFFEDKAQDSSGAVTGTVTTGTVTATVATRTVHIGITGIMCVHPGGGAAGSRHTAGGSASTPATPALVVATTAVSPTSIYVDFSEQTLLLKFGAPLDATSAMNGASYTVMVDGLPAMWSIRPTITAPRVLSP